MFLIRVLSFVKLLYHIRLCVILFSYMKMPTETSEPTERREVEPPENPPLKIKCEFPSAIYEAIESQFERTDSTGMARGFLGEKIGFSRPGNPHHPLREVETRVHGNMRHTQFVDVPDKPGHRQGVGERIKEFNIETRFRLPDAVYIDNTRTIQMTQIFEMCGYETSIQDVGNGNRRMTLKQGDHSFELIIGWENADALAQYYIQSGKEHPGLGLDNSEAVMQRKNKTEFKLGITNSHPRSAPEGFPLKSKEQVLGYIEASRRITEITAFALVAVTSPGKRYPDMNMDWLPPTLVEKMTMRESSQVVGTVEPLSLVETQTAEGFGLERLAGLAPETLAELTRIKERLQDPRRAEFMKKYGFKQSNGAVFWGVPGTGKTLAGEALAEEAGCERVILKIDEYMTAYIHESSHRLGEKLREIKTNSTGKDRPVVVQIDEADTILMPINGGAGGFTSAKDASEIRAVLLREFQEPSNVFYILTTNLDPRDARQADPAIVRNQRLGYLVAFDMPNEDGRQEIYEKEAGKRTGADLKWENVDFSIIAKASERFSPADIQEALSIAVNEGYDPDTGASFVNQQHLETAVALIKSRKLAEERMRRPMGFIPQNQTQSQ